ncbi:hypothetical protein LLH06_05930 [Mucilaginibacter daejeonensis]|uniref:hypothetical protein n=1 Tax=Mucilaginibacter daejeonensis TaxID=398049 RepID=UPI001D1716D2|nr:hypothetical protein [Mucilaginibacter daejeonensis]UEG54500.1 hypothetical protein LLH06_05930 [Mucilaginibacter daejeonensis]
MLAFDQDTWTTEQEIPTQLRRNAGADELERNRISRAAAPDPEDEDIEDDDLDLDDEDLDYDEEDEDDLDADVVPDYDEDLDDEDDADLNDPIRAEIDEDDDLLDGDTEYDPASVPGREEAADEQLGAPSEQEVNPPQEGNDASYSEQTDVTPPRPHEFPSEGSPKTDFTSRDHGRTTGRMIGHEPGTEGI